MHVEVFTLCDSATNTLDKLNILGTFDTLWSKKWPTLHPFCSLALRLRFNRIEQGVHEIKIDILNENAQEVLQLLNKMLPIYVKGQEHTGTFTLVLNIQNLKLEEFGAYAVVLMIDQSPIITLPLYVRQSSQ